MNITCRNCGSNTHTTNNCRNPVTSYGIILFKYDNDIPKILMINRKDSLCYIDFLRGKYNINNLNYIQILINKFSNSEKQNILTKDYDTLWKDLWLITEIENKFFSDYNRGKDKFNQLKQGYQDKKMKVNINLEYFVKNSKTDYKSTEWEFPKGRRNNSESNKDCAIREFKEETNYNYDDYELIINIAPFTENYMGENKVRYRHVYYIGYLKNYEKELIITDNADQRLEISDIRWATMDESLSYIRNYHKTRETVIQNVFRLLTNLKNYILI